jgi:hypothetical protein
MPLMSERKNMKNLVNNHSYFSVNNSDFDCKFLSHQYNGKEVCVSGVEVDNKFISPYYGPFSDFSFSCAGSFDNGKLIEGLLQKINKEYVSYEFTICPEFYGIESSVIVCTMLTYGATIKTIELNNHIDLKSFKGINRANSKKLQQLRDKSHIARQASVSDLWNIYNLLKDNRESKNNKLSLSFEKILILFNSFPENFKCWAVYDANNNMRASSITLDMNDAVRYVFYWGDRPENESLSPVVLLADHLIQDSIKDGFLYLDLGTSSINGNINFGLRNFKRSLGAIDSFKIKMEK